MFFMQKYECTCLVCGDARRHARSAKEIKTNLKFKMVSWVFTCTYIVPRWFSALYILSPNFHTKRSSHDASGSKLGIVWPSIFQSNWGGPLLGVQDQCFTAPKMRFCSDLFCQNWRSFDKQQYFASPEGTTVSVPHQMALARSWEKTIPLCKFTELMQWQHWS